MFEKGLINTSLQVLRLKGSNHGYAPQTERALIYDTAAEFICSQNLQA